MVDVSVNMDIDSDMAVSINWGGFFDKGGWGSFQGVWV